MTMTIGGASFRGLTDAMVRQMEYLGITTDLRKVEGSSWVCVMNGGKVVYEETSSDFLSYKGDFSGKTIELHSSPTSKAVTIIDGEIQGLVAKGLNITVYSKSMLKVIDSVRFNTASVYVPTDRK